MYDTTKLSADELHTLATYIFPNSNRPFDQMLADLAPLGIRILKGTIGKFKGRYFEEIFLQSSYWKILSGHFRQQGICPLCKQAKRLVIAPAYHHLGINHLHLADHLLACAECHLIASIGDHRFWQPLKDEEDYDVSQFLTLLRRHK